MQDVLLTYARTFTALVEVLIVQVVVVRRQLLSSFSPNLLSMPRTAITPITTTLRLHTVIALVATTFTRL